MAASISRQTKVTLTSLRLLDRNNNSRLFSTCQACLGSFWEVRGKPKRKKDFHDVQFLPQEKTDKPPLEHINIPDRIERSPTAILEALASTVKNDVNQPMYLTIDDPHLYATSDRVKKNSLAAMEAGRNTAQMMLSMYPDYFTQIWDEPLPQAWKDPFQGYDHKEPGEQALLERVSKQKVSDALHVYKAMKADGIPASQAAQEQLLELLTVFNSQNPNKNSDISNYIDAPDLSKNAPFPVSTWKKGSMAEEVFHSLPEKTAKAYCYMIRAMASNFEKEGALNLYNEMRASNLPVDVYTYNKLLSVASLDIENVEDMSHFIEVILRDMSASGVVPDVETFNAVLSNCRRVSRWTGSKKYALSVLAEMKACGLEPTLGTYTSILNIFYYFRDKSTKTPNLFENMLDHLEGKEFTCTTESDAIFFRSAMRVIMNHFPDSRLALRLHSILKSGNNRDLLGHRQLHYGYYNDLFAVIIPLEHIDVVMDIYQNVVPYIFFPSSETITAILDSIEMHDSYHYMPILYSDLQWTAMFKDTPFITRFVQTLTKQKQEPQIQAQLCDVVRSLLSEWEEKKMFKDRPAVNRTVIGDSIIVFLNNGDLKTAWDLFQTFQDNQTFDNSDPSQESLTKLAEHLIAAQDYSSTKEVLNMMLSLDYEGIPALVESSLKTFDLSDQERHFLQGVAESGASSSSTSDSE